MFLKNKSASGRFQFDEVYSCLQKALRRGDVTTSLEMVKEFRDYPNALKKRLIYDCCEDCPDLNLINEIYSTPAELNALSSFIPVICKHIKCREVIMTFRVACERDYDFAPLTSTDDMLTTTRKLMTQICAKSFKADESSALLWLLDNIEHAYPDKYEILKTINVKRIFGFINKCRTVMFAVIAFCKIPYITTFVPGTKLTPVNIDYTTFTLERLPKWTYDKHVHNSPASQRGYAFFINNIVLKPRMKETNYEHEGGMLYISTNRGSGDHFIRTFAGLHNPWSREYMDLNKMKLLQTQLITARHKPRTYFAGDEFEYIVKGPLSADAGYQQVLSDKLKECLGLVSEESELHICTFHDEPPSLYMLALNLVEIEPSNVVVKTSKLESNVTIYNGQTYVYHDSMFPQLTKAMKLELFKCLFFRKLIGTNDTCGRNLICTSDVIASIDDPVLYKRTEFMFKKQLNEQLSGMYMTALKQLWSKLNKYIKRCRKWLIDYAHRFELTNDEIGFMVNMCDEMNDITNWRF